MIVVQDERKTSRSQEIDGNSFREELCSSNRTGRLVVSEDKMSLNAEQTHDRTRRPVATLHKAAAQNDSSVNSASSPSQIAARLWLRAHPPAEPRNRPSAQILVRTKPGKTTTAKMQRNPGQMLSEETR